MTTVTLRPVTAEEYDARRGPAIEAYAQELADAAHGPVDATIRAKAEGSFAPTLTEASAAQGTHIMRILDDSGAAVGWLWLARNPLAPDMGFVYDIEVDEAHQGRGLGRAAMSAAEDVLRADGCERLGLNVFGANERAIALYRSLGYQVDSMFMSKPLEDQS